MDATLPLAREDVVFRALGDEYAILDSAGEVVHVLNATAAAVWLLCDGAHDVAAIAREVATLFQSGPMNDVVEDVRGAITAFTERGLLR
jgi:hypothetical protein